MKNVLFSPVWRYATLTLSTLALVMVISSCEEEDEIDFSFIDQIAQGSIDGAEWTFADGIAEIDDFSGGLSIQLSNEEYSDPCDEFIIKTQMRVFIYNKAEVGVYKIIEDSNENNSDGFANFIGVGFVDGGVEITSVGSQVRGKIDVSYTDDMGVVSEINGNFTVDFCE